MRWEEVRKIYPNQYVLVKILNSYTVDNKEIIDDVAIIRGITDPKEATHELMKSKADTLVYHTKNTKIEIEIRQYPGFRRVL